MFRARSMGVAASGVPPLRFLAAHARLLALLLLLPALAACAMPAPQYEDPLAGFDAAAPAAQRFEDVRLGVIFSDNVQKSLGYVQEYHAKMASFGVFANTTAMEDLDATYVPTKLKEILARSFKETVKVETMDQVRSQGLDAAMIFDMRTELGVVSGDQTSVALTGSFLGPDGAKLAEVSGQGAAPVPYPAMTVGYKAAASGALKAFANDLGSSRQLGTAMDELAAPPALAVTEPAAPASAEPYAGTGTAAPSPVPSGVDFGRYHAVVVGIDNYTALPRLRTARNDARAVAETLRQDYGYHVRLLLDASRAQVLDALGEMRRTLTDRDNLLVYYAGHGWLDRDADQGFWLPVDATPDSEVNWISNDTVSGALKAIQAKHVLVVSDSCYSGKLTRGLHIVQRTPDYFERMARLRTRLVMASGGLEPVSDTGEDGHSVFARAFLRALDRNTGIMDGTGLFTLIRRPVMLDSDQTPEYADIRKAGHEGGDFLFVRR